MTEGLNDDEQEGFRSERAWVNQIITLKQKGEKAREKKRRIYKGFIELEKARDMGNMESL